MTRIVAQKPLLTMVLVLAFLALVSCSTNSTKEHAEAAFDELDSLRGTLLTLDDSLLHTWNVMINDDNKKIKNMYRLVQEVSYAGGIDSTITGDLLTKVKSLKKMRYTCKTMSDSDLIDSYDSASGAIADMVINLATNHPEFERNPLMNELIDEISEAQSRILFYRIDYDDVAKLHNSFIEQHSAILNEISAEHDRNRLSLFELAPEQ